MSERVHHTPAWIDLCVINLVALSAGSHREEMMLGVVTCSASLPLGSSFPLIPQRSNRTERGWFER